MSRVKTIDTQGTKNSTCSLRTCNHVTCTSHAWRIIRVPVQELAGIYDQARPAFTTGPRNTQGTTTQTLHVCHICRSVGVVPGGSMGRQSYGSPSVPLTLGLQSYLRFEGGTGVGGRVQIPEEVRLEPLGSALAEPVELIRSECSVP